MKEYVQLTLKDIAFRRAAIEQELDSLRQAEEIIRRLDDDSPSEKLPLISAEEARAHATQLQQELSKQVPPLPIVKPPSQTSPPPQHKARPAKDRQTFSKYRGVTQGRTRKDGTITYRAAPYKDGKVNFLGTFTIEELAAAAVEKFLGNDSEAERLQKIGEQKETGRSKRHGRKSSPPESAKTASPKTHYKGVKVCKPLADGTLRYEAHVTIEGKFKYLGTFDKQELAAATAAEARGEMAEAKRLRQLAADLVEQEENNPERGRSNEGNGSPNAGEQGLQSPSQIVAWECNRCGKRVDQSERPKICTKCIKDNGFSPIRERLISTAGD